MPFSARPFAAHLEIRHAGAVLRHGFVLGDLQALGVEEGGQALQLLPVFASDRAEAEAGRREEVRHGHEVVVRLVRVHAADADRAEGRRLKGRACPLARLCARARRAGSARCPAHSGAGSVGSRCSPARLLRSVGVKSASHLPFALKIRPPGGGQQRAGRIGLPAPPSNPSATVAATGRQTCRPWHRRACRSSPTGLRGEGTPRW